MHEALCMHARMLMMTMMTMMTVMIGGEEASSPPCNFLLHFTVALPNHAVAGDGPVACQSPNQERHRRDTRPAAQELFGLLGISCTKVGAS